MAAISREFLFESVLNYSTKHSNSAATLCTGLGTHVQSCTCVPLKCVHDAKFGTHALQLEITLLAMITTVSHGMAHMHACDDQGSCMDCMHGHVMSLIDRVMCVMHGAHCNTLVN